MCLTAWPHRLLIRLPSHFEVRLVQGLAQAGQTATIGPANRWKETQSAQPKWPEGCTTSKNAAQELQNKLNILPILTNHTP